MSVLLYEWVAASSAVGCCGHPGPQVLVHLLAMGGAAGGAAGRRSSCSAHHDTHRPIASSCRHAARDDSDHGRRNGRRCWHRWCFCTVVAGGEGVAVCVSRRAAVGPWGDGPRRRSGVWWLCVMVVSGTARPDLRASDDVTDCHTDHQERRHRPSDVGSGPSDVGTAAAPSWTGL